MLLETLFKEMIYRYSNSNRRKSPISICNFTANKLTLTQFRHPSATLRVRLEGIPSTRKEF